MRLFLKVCESDTDFKTENYNHHDGEHTFSRKSTKTQSKNEDVLYIVALYYCKKRRIQFIWTVQKRNLKRTLNAIIQYEENWLGWMVIERLNCKWYYFPLTFPEINYALKLSKPLRKKQLWWVLRKWRQNAWRRMC